MLHMLAVRGCEEAWSKAKRANRLRPVRRAPSHEIYLHMLHSQASSVLYNSHLVERTHLRTDGQLVCDVILCCSDAIRLQHMQVSASQKWYARCERCTMLRARVRPCSHSRTRRTTSTVLSCRDSCGCWCPEGNIATHCAESAHLLQLERHIHRVESRRRGGGESESRRPPPNHGQVPVQNRSLEPLNG
jgi:hypothetical protein